jgi:hypothetical protein
MKVSLTLFVSGLVLTVALATAGHRSMSTTKGYLHLAGVVFRRAAPARGRRSG